MNPHLSIVMAVYNGAEKLPTTIDSIRSQTFKDWELIVVDDGSTDSTLSILEDYRRQDPRIHILSNINNLKLAASLNHGISMARAGWIARQDCGDISHPERLQKQIDFLKENVDVILVGTAFTVLAPDGQPITTITMPETDPSIRQAMLQRNPFAHGSVIFRKDAFEQAGYYNIEFLAAQDYDLWLRLQHLGRMANLSTPLYFWYFDTQSTTLANYALQYGYMHYAKTKAFSPENLQDVRSFIAMAPVVENYINWLLMAVQSKHQELCDELVATLWERYRVDLESRDFMVPYMVKWGVKLAFDHHISVIEDVVSCFYRDYPYLESHVMRRIYIRVSDQPFKLSIVMHGLLKDVRSWPQLLFTCTKRIASSFHKSFYLLLC